jgi:hypothetical protein
VPAASARVGETTDRAMQWPELATVPSHMSAVGKPQWLIADTRRRILPDRLA